MMTANKESSAFDSYYFQHGCGRPYERDDEWLNFFDSIAERIVEDFQPKTVLDAGCALGFLVEGLRDRGVEAFGFDISEYAISNVHQSIKDYCELGSVTDPFPRKYDVIVCIEVLEHLKPQDSYKAIENICSFTEDVLFSSTPFDFKEATHFNVQAPEVWAEHFARYGFLRDVDYDASFITEWAVRFVKKQQPLHRTVKDFERRYWSLSKENTDLRELVNEMRDTISASDGDIRSYREELKSKESELASLHMNVLEWNARWEEVETSMGWTIFRALQRVRGKLAPQGSARHRFLQRVFWSALLIKQRMRKRIRHKPSQKISMHEESSDIAPAELEPLDEPRKSPENRKTSGSSIHSTSGSLRLALFTTDRWYSASARIRLIGPSQHFGSGISVVKGTEWENESVINLPDDVDGVVIQRDFPRHEDYYKKVVDWARSSSKFVVFEIDDLLIQLPTEHPEHSYYEKARTGMIDAMAQADAVIVSSRELVQVIRKHNLNTWHLPNYLDDQIWDLTTNNQFGDSEKVTFGYMGGITKTHLPDLDMIVSVLVKMLNKYPDKFYLRFWGLVHPELLGHPNVEYIEESFPNYSEFAQYFIKQECDAFIAPLRDNVFNRCKSSIKFLEYSALGVPGIYSKLPPYANDVVHGTNGFLASNSKQWEECLIRLLSDRKMRSRMGQEARRTVIQHKLLSNHAHEWGTVYRSAIAAAFSG